MKKSIALSFIGIFILIILIILLLKPWQIDKAEQIVVLEKPNKALYNPSTPKQINTNSLIGALQSEDCQDLGRTSDRQKCFDYVYIRKNRDTSGFDCDNVKDESIGFFCVLAKDINNCWNLPEDKLEAIDCKFLISYVSGKSEIIEADASTENLYNIIKAFVNRDTSVCNDIRETGKSYDSKEFCMVLAR